MNKPLRFNPVDLADLIETEASGIDNLLTNLIQDFKATLPDTLSSIESALNEGRPDELERYAHTLKSSSRLLGLHASSVLCADIEHLACDKAPVDLALVTALKTEINQAVEDLIQFDTSRKAA